MLLHLLVNARGNTEHVLNSTKELRLQGSTPVVGATEAEGDWGLGNATVHQSLSYNLNSQPGNGLCSQ
jgi:hypothetical protein